MILFSLQLIGKPEEDKIGKYFEEANEEENNSMDCYQCNNANFDIFNRYLSLFCPLQNDDEGSGRETALKKKELKKIIQDRDSINDFYKFIEFHEYTIPNTENYPPLIKKTTKEVKKYASIFDEEESKNHKIRQAIIINPNKFLDTLGIDTWLKTILFYQEIARLHEKKNHQNVKKDQCGCIKTILLQLLLRKLKDINIFNVIFNKTQQRWYVSRYCFYTNNDKPTLVKIEPLQLSYFIKFDNKNRQFALKKYHNYVSKIHQKNKIFGYLRHMIFSKKHLPKNIFYLLKKIFSVLLTKIKPFNKN